MSVVVTDAPPPPPTPAPPVPRGRPLLAWLVIAGVVAFILWRYWTQPEEQKQELDLVSMQLQARASVGLANLFRDNAPTLYQQLQTLNRGTYRQRLCFVVLAGELAGPEEARNQLQKLEETWQGHGLTPDEEDAELTELLRRLYAEHAEGPAALAGQEQQQLREQLGWFGELALAPAEGPDAAARARVLAPARRAAVVNLAAALVIILLIVVGAVVLVLVLILGLMGVLRSKFWCGSSHAGIYAETFAAYMLLFLGISYSLKFLPEGSLGRWGLLFSGLAALGSLAALAWPVLRGVPWHRVRQDVGWYVGRRPWLEPLFGLGCYTTAWPLLLVGLLLSFGIRTVREHVMGPPDPFGPTGDPAHPLVMIVTSHNWVLWLQAFFVAGVVAPVVEETMFRGVLYRHLREATRGFGRVLSVLTSAAAVSFVFAVIHPQGVQGVPVLMALAVSFALAREWRGTILPAVVAHGLNNTAITLLLLLVAT